MNDEEVMKLEAAERIQVYLQQMQLSRKESEQNKRRKDAKRKEKEKLEAFQKKQAEHKFDIDPNSRPK